MLGIEREQLMSRCLANATGNLNARLLPDANVAFRRAALRTIRQRQRKSCQICQRLDVPDTQLLFVKPGQACDKGQMVVFSALAVTLGPPLANLTMRGRIPGRL